MEAGAAEEEDEEEAAVGWREWVVEAEGCESVAVEVEVEGAGREGEAISWKKERRETKREEREGRIWSARVSPPSLSLELPLLLL